MSRRFAALAVAALCVAFLAVGTGTAWAGSTPTTPTEPYNNNGECMYCHQPGGSAVSTVSFPVDTSVNRTTACMKCHWEQTGSHPFHNPTWNCGSCHSGMLFTNPAAIPAVVTTYGYFHTMSSAEADSRSLHIIHSNPTWAGNLTKKGRQCASCHAAAACTACHEDPDLTHSEHAWDVGLGDYWPGSEPDGKPYGSGTSVGFETERNVNTALTCSNATCHMTASGDDAPVMAEDFGGGIVYTGSGWGRSSTTGYTNNSYMRSNAASAMATYVFAGEKIEFITDRHPYRGLAKVSLDGVEVTTTDLYAPAVEKQFIAYTSGTLSAGNHTITVEVLRQKNVESRDYFVVIDAFRVYPKLTLTLTNCTECHAPDSFTGSDVDRSAAHANPAAHMATETALSISTTSTVRASVSCTSVCHVDGIDSEHASVIASASPASMVDGAVSCAECHASAKYTPFAAPGVGDWKKNCYECHAVRHDTINAKHTFSVTSSGTCGPGAGTGCHEVSRIDRVHFNATDTPNPAVYNNCNVCHRDDGKPLGTLNGGAPANDCSDCHSGHAASHVLLLPQSNYAESSADGTATGCTNAGNGCHLSLGAGNTSTDISDYHPASGCTLGACHTSTGKPSHHTPFVCGDCHDNTYQYAVDTTALADPAPAGHYGDTTHTATSGLSTVSVSGTASETCSVCHNLTLKDAHTGIASQTKGTKVTCNECHSYNAAVVTEIKTNNWTNSRCDDCHKSGVITISIQHPTAVTAVATATASAGCASTGLNCHNTNDLHVVHKNAAAGCDLAGCHDAASKNRKPTTTSCGASGCHTSGYTATNHSGATGNNTTHTAGSLQGTSTTYYATQCNTCHFMALSSEHTKTTSAGAPDCAGCHNNAGSTTAISGKWSARLTTGACAACHGVGGIPAAHAGNFTSLHTTTSAGCSSSGAGCHNTSDISTTTVLHTGGCTRCHSTTYVPANKTCGNTRACHNSSYDTSTNVHNGSSGAGLADGNDLAHHTATLAAGAYTGADAVDSDTQACSLCHSATMSVAHTSTRVGQVTCSGCHNSSVVATSPLVVKASWPTKKCTACHNAGATTHASIETTHNFTGTGCASSGAGCHNTSDVRTLHAGKGCAITGCHGVDKKMNTEVKTCGAVSGGCHSGHTATNHNGRTGDDTTHTANAAYMQTKVDGAGTKQLDCTGCHISTLGSEHNTVTVDTTVTGGNKSISCTECHNNTGSSGAPSSSVTVIKPGPWSDQCSACHTATRTSGHVTSTPGPHAVNDSTMTVGGAFCTSCHGGFTSNISTAHSEATTIVASVTYNTCNVCHRGSADTSLTTLYTKGAAWDCADCHPNNRNSHGISAGARACYGCHAYQSSMEATYGATRTGTYHHVMGSNTASGDVAPGGAATYPTSNQDVYCVSCHTDHNYFNGSSATSPAANLRYDIADNNPSAAAESTNADFIQSGNYGVCVSCHKSVLNVDNANQKARPYSQSQIVSGGVYTNSSHDYYATSTYSLSTFRADCAKCHTDDAGLDTPNRQSSSTKFATHQSAERNILSALGGTQTDPYEEQFCYRCHSGAGPNDDYGVTSMTAMSRAVQTSFTAGASRHPLTPNANGSVVSCVNCHNPHQASASATSQDPDNTYANLANGATFCLRCHDGATPNARQVSPSLVSTPVVIGASVTATMNKNTYASEGHWTQHDSIGAGQTQSCERCHEQHGSSLPKLLLSVVNGAGVTGNNNTACYACHTSASSSFPASSTGSLDASFYPINGAWPSKVLYDASQHATSVPGVVWPGSGYATGDCKNCHDVHGTANAYDALVATYSASNFTVCFACHDADGPAADNVKSKYPVAAGGTSTGPRSGHRTISTTGTVLSGDAAIPCYACHNPHGSAEATFGLMVVTRSNNTTYVIGDASNEISVSTPAGVRKFCFTCHTTADGNTGFNGSVYASVVAGDRALGFNRYNQMPSGSSTGPHLRLPNVGGHYLADTEDCFTCHADPHEPTAGLSTGASACYGCHNTYQSPMEDGLATQTGTIRATVYHHVLGSAAQDGDIAPGASAYPTSTTNVYCVSCHTDHNYFNANKAKNLRSDIASGSGNATAATDFAYIAGAKAASNVTTNGFLTTSVSGPWSNITNANGVYGATVASSSANNAFEATQSFVGWPSNWDSITDATITVRSQAARNGWGRSFSGQAGSSDNLRAVVPTQNGDIGGTWGTTGWANVDEYPTAVTADRIISGAAGAYYHLFPHGSSPATTVPSNATNIRVIVGFNHRDDTTGGSGNNDISARLKVGGSYYDTATVEGASAAYTNETDTWALNPATGLPWTPDEANGIGANSIDQYGVNITNATVALRVTQVYMQLMWDIPTIPGGTNDDTWQIDYSINAGLSWAPIQAATTTSESALTSHTVSLTGVLTPANAANFRVRILGATVDSADNSGTVGWESSTLQYRYDRYTTAPSYGICVSCHIVSLAKQDADTLDGPGNTPVIDGAGFAGSAHEYTVNSTFNDATSFAANCSKCHSDEQNKLYQSGNEFGTHWSAYASILRALGTFTADPPQEQACYKCHTATGEKYGTSMSAAAKATESQFASASTHPLTKVTCSNCHNVHEASATVPVADPDNTYDTASVATTAGINAFCVTCHDGSAPVAVTDGTTLVPATVTVAATANVSANWSANGHGRVGGPGMDCRDCHEQHGSNLPKLIMTPLNGATPTGNNNTVCFACHNTSSGLESWSASGYPTDGQWPGSTTYTAGIHRNVTGGGSAAGECKNCHDPHGTASDYDMLSANGASAFSPADGYGLCFECHDGSPATDNVKQFYPTAAGGTASSATSPGAGHATVSTSTVLPKGSALPCYMCHNPHGSAAASWALEVNTQFTAGVNLIVGDQSSEITYTKAMASSESSAAVRKFCYTCHASADATPMGWNGSMYATVNAGAMVAGMDRTDGTKSVKLPWIDQHMIAGTQSCYECHADPAKGYTVHAPCTKPSEDWRQGAYRNCYNCHAYEEAMEDGSGTETGSVRTNAYHHVLGGTIGATYYNGGLGVYNGATTRYPDPGFGGPTQVFCISCHVDHNYFRNWAATDQPALNLRSSGSSVSVVATSTDFGTAANPGICVGCHNVRIARDNTSQTANNESLVDTIGATEFAASAHTYDVTSTFAGAANYVFRADCAKCHSDEQNKRWQTSSRAFGTHWSAEERLLGALGVTSVTNPAEERVCLSCHRHSGEAISGYANKGTDGKDFWGVASMSATSEDLWGQIASTYGHHVSSGAGTHAVSSEVETRGYISANKHIECGDCHNVHEAQASRHSTGTNAVSGALRGVSGARVTTGASNWTSPTYSMVATSSREYEICFKCHSGFNTSRVSSGLAGVIPWGGSGSGAWTDQGLEFSTSNNSYHPVLAALPSADASPGSSQLQANDMRAPFQVGGVWYGGWARGRTMHCSDCHAQSGAGSFGPHGSSVKWMLKGPNQAWPYMSAADNGKSTGTYRIGSDYANSINLNLDTPDGLFCRNCHDLPTGQDEHDRGTDHDIACVACHIRVPHGGKVSRLICANNSSGLGNLPARYSGDGQGGWPTGGHVTGFVKQAGGTYNNASMCGQSGCTQHSLSLGESW